VGDEAEDVLDLTEEAPGQDQDVPDLTAEAEEEDVLDLTAEVAREEDVLDLTAELEAVAGDADASEVSIVLTEEESNAGFLDLAGVASGDMEAEASVMAQERPDDDMILEFSDTAELADIVGTDAPAKDQGKTVDANGAFGQSLDHEIESALGISDAVPISPEEEEIRLQRAARVSVNIRNRGEVDKPTDFNFDAMHAWHDSVRKQISESGGELLSERQMEAALSRAIKEIYAEKFEKMIEQVLEKTILKEIERLKRLVTSDD